MVAIVSDGCEMAFHGCMAYLVGFVGVEPGIPENADGRTLIQYPTHFSIFSFCLRLCACYLVELCAGGVWNGFAKKLGVYDIAPSISCTPQNIYLFIYRTSYRGSNIYLFIGYTIYSWRECIYGTH